MKLVFFFQQTNLLMRRRVTKSSNKTENFKKGQQIWNTITEKMPVHEYMDTLENGKVHGVLVRNSCNK